MFNKLKYISVGIDNNIPTDLQLFLWNLIDTMNVEKKDYLQVFKISSIYKENTFKLIVIHSQELPNYIKEHLIAMNILINEKIYVIDEGPYSTMLLESEY